MTASKSLATYADIEAILDTALRMGQWPAKVVQESHADCVVWRSRANKFRHALRRAEEVRLNLPDGTGTCKYDGLQFLLADQDNRVIIRPRPASATVLHIGDQKVQAVSDRELDAVEEESLPRSEGLGLEVKS